MALFGLVGLGSRSWNVYTMIGKGGFEKGTYRTEVAVGYSLERLTMQAWKKYVVKPIVR